MAINFGSILPGLGKALGTGMAQPLNQTLDMLAQDKLMQLQEASQSRMMGRQAAQQQAAAQAERQRYTQGLAPLIGEQAAHLMSNLSPQERKAAFQNIGSLRQLSGDQMAGQPSAMDLLSQQASPEQAPPERADIPRAGIQSPTQESMAQRAQGVTAAPRSKAAGKDKIIEDIFTSPAERRQREQLQLAKDKLENQIQQFDKTLKLKQEQFGKNLDIKQEQLGEKRATSTREFSKPYIEKAEASRANIKDYDKLIKLAEKGDIRAGPVQQLLSKFGLEDFGKNFDSQLVDKLNARLAQNATSAFGTGRLTNFLEQTFQRSIPSLWNTPEGIIAISKMNKLADQANIIKDDVRRQLIDKNKGKIPYDMDDQILAIARPKIDQLEAKAIEAMNIKSKTPKIGEFVNALPDPSSEPEGTEYTNEDDGSVYRRVGKAWMKV